MENMVNIYCITYNHREIIRKCLDGFVMQKTTFPFQIWIHDDCSTDGTIDILKEYEKQYPNLINVIYEKENQHSKGISMDSIMLPIVKKDCKYIATCEGDDYWTDEYKLQKQFDYMEKNDNATICVHAAIEHNLETNKEFVRPALKESREISMQEIIMFGGGFFPTCSFFTRNNFEVIPRRWGRGIVGDFNEILHAALNGTVYYIADCMAVKTVFYPGSWSSRHKDSSLMEQHLERVIDGIQRLNVETNYEYDSTIQEKIKNYKYRLNCELRGNNKLLFTDSYYKAIYRTLPKKKKIRAFLLTFFKPLYSLYSVLKKISVKIKFKNRG